MKYLALVSLLFIFSGCVKSDQWQNVYIKSGVAKFDSSKLIYPASNFCQDVELELLNTNNSLFIYINVYAGPVASYKNNPKEALVIFETPNEQFQLVAERLEGGQRIRIPLASTTFVVDLMKSSNYLTIRLEDSYKSKVHTAHFEEHYRKLKSLPPLFITNAPVSLAL